MTAIVSRFADRSGCARHARRRLFAGRRQGDPAPRGRGRLRRRDRALRPRRLFVAAVRASAFSRRIWRCFPISSARGPARRPTISSTPMRSPFRSRSPASWLASPVALALGLIWIAHIGMDRMLGYGLKYASGFGDTHLGRIGQRVRTTQCAFTPFRPAGCGSRRARSSAEVTALSAALRR